MLKLNVQFFGGRGAASAGGTSAGNMNVPYDRWGPMIDKEVRDEDGTIIGYIEDVERSVYEDYVESVTKKDVLSDIDMWRNDDGTYGDNDVSINLAYKDGTFVDVNALDGKAYKKTGIIGASISTGDYEMVWGGEINKKTGKFLPWQTWSEDGESGYSNSMVGAKAVGSYKVRIKVTQEPYYNRHYEQTMYRTVRKTIRQSKVKRW